LDHGTPASPNALQKVFHRKEREEEIRTPGSVSLGVPGYLLLLPARSGGFEPHRMPANTEERDAILAFLFAF